MHVLNNFAIIPENNQGTNTPSNKKDLKILEHTSIHILPFIVNRLSV